MGFQTVKKKLPVPRGTTSRAKAAASSPCWDPAPSEQCSWLILLPHRCLRCLPTHKWCVPVTHPPSASEGRVLTAVFCSCPSGGCTSAQSLVCHSAEALCWAQIHLGVNGSAEPSWDGFMGKSASSGSDQYLISYELRFDLGREGAGKAQETPKPNTHKACGNPCCQWQF